MKKTILILAMVLVIAAVAVVCVSCAKKEEKANTVETATVSFTVVNNSGKGVTEFSLTDRKSDGKLSAKPEGVWEDGSAIDFTMQAVIENNAPDLMFSFTIEDGSNYSSTIYQKEGTITLVTRDDGISFDLSDPAK